MSFDVGAWWDSLDLISQVYWVVTIPATLLFVIQLIMTFMGSDTDDAHEGDFDSEGGFHFLTIKNMIAFFALFGWTGLACIEATFSTAIILMVSFFAGLVMMFVMASIYYFMSRLSQSGTLEMKNAIGAVGEVYLSIPARRTGTGKVQVKVQGGMRTLDAMTEELEIIKSGSVIEVTDVVNDHILIVKRNR